MKELFKRQGLIPYEAPETEVIETVFETGFLILSNETDTSTVPDLVEEDYSDSIWN
ncbi:MAG: hypothetical protein IJP49_05235 [Bacteroidales bacterium]|nr:hypothetical protein [Bacteroidales bacterium]